jgi:hypothetical protein
VIDWSKLVQERNEWVAYNFPDSSDTDHTIMGVIEELGELVHAHIKRAQGIRMEEDHDARAKDSVGDATVYLLGVMNKVGIPDSRSVAGRVEESDIRETDRIILALAREVGDLSGRHLLYYHRWPAYLALITERIVYLLSSYCALLGWDYDAIVNDTWSEVKKRDWVAHRLGIEEL